MCKLGGANTEISKRNSTGNASWGVGPNKADVKSAYNNVQVGGGANTENFEKKFYRQCELGGTTIKKYFSIEISISYA